MQPIIGLGVVGLVTSSQLSISIGGVPPMDASAEMVAAKFFAAQTAAITDLDVYLTIGGTVSDTTFTLEVQTDSADTPSGTILGAPTAAFSGPAATGWIGLKALGTPTGALTVNTPYWVVLKRTGGGALSATDLVRITGTGSDTSLNRAKIRHHNGTNWTTTAPANVTALMVFRHTSVYSGYPHTVTVTTSSQPDIFGANRQGLRFKVGARQTLAGVTFLPQKTGSPAALQAVLYEGAIERASGTAAAGDLANQVQTTIYFDPPYTTAADTMLYIVLRQVANGGTDANDYDLRTVGCNATYLSGYLGDDYRMVAGTGDDPTALTVIHTEMPTMLPLIHHLGTDLTQTIDPSYQMGVL